MGWMYGLAVETLLQMPASYIGMSALNLKQVLASAVHVLKLNLKQKVLLCSGFLLMCILGDTTRAQVLGLLSHGRPQLDSKFLTSARPTPSWRNFESEQVKRGTMPLSKVKINTFYKF